VVYIFLKNGLTKIELLKKKKFFPFLKYFNNNINKKKFLQIILPLFLNLNNFIFLWKNEELGLKFVIYVIEMLIFLLKLL
jgi:hypothetical protein